MLAWGCLLHSGIIETEVVACAKHPDQSLRYELVTAIVMPTIFLTLSIAVSLATDGGRLIIYFRFLCLALLVPYYGLVVTGVSVTQAVIDHCMG